MKGKINYIIKELRRMKGKERKVERVVTKRKWRGNRKRERSGKRRNITNEK